MTLRKLQQKLQFQHQESMFKFIAKSNYTHFLPDKAMNESLYFFLHVNMYVCMELLSLLPTCDTTGYTEAPT